MNRWGGKVRDIVRIATAAAALVGCGGDGTGPVDPIVGRYDLAGVHGSPLPYPYLSVTIDSGFLVLEESQRFDLAIYGTTSTGALQVVVDSAGMYDQAVAGSVRLDFAGGGSRVAQLAGDTIFLSTAGMAFEFAR